MARILVRCPNHVGDVVMSTPGLAALRAAHPDAEIVAQLPAPLAPLLEGAGLVDAIWSLPPRSAGRMALLREARRIAAHRFDLGIAIPESISSALLMRLGRIRRVVGFARDPLRRGLLHVRVPADPAWGRRRLVSRERFVLRLVEAAGAKPIDGPPRLVLATTEDEAARLDAVAGPLGLSRAALPRVRPVVIAPGAGFGEAKCWPPASFGALADALIGRGVTVVLVGAPGEQERIAAVRRAMTRAPIVLDGVLDLGGLKVLLQHARLLVANDAGTRHVAAAFGVPSVVFFGPTAVAKTPDNLERVAVLETEHACRPCYRRRCPIDHRCLRDVSVGSALEAALGIVEQGA
ncbi:MAG: lipopolysaccharide heptosyltransferase II [Myxococcota bacterium]